MAFAVWITGLPGSGKSTIAEELTKKLPGAIYLRLDAIRKQFIKDPVFTDDERERTYQLFSAEGERLVDEGKSVIYDATAHKRAWRDDARRIHALNVKQRELAGLCRRICIKRRLSAKRQANSSISLGKSWVSMFNMRRTARRSLSLIQVSQAPKKLRK
jgi:predicted kinase